MKEYKELVELNRGEADKNVITPSFDRYTPRFKPVGWDPELQMYYRNNYEAIEDQKKLREDIKKCLPKQKLINGNLDMYHKNLNWLKKKSNIEHEKRMKGVEDENEICSF